MLGTPDADPRKRDIMCQNPALIGLKRHEKTIVSMLFSAFGAYMGDAEFQHPALSWRLKGQKCGEKWGDGAPWRGIHEVHKAQRQAKRRLGNDESHPRIPRPERAKAFVGAKIEN